MSAIYPAIRVEDEVGGGSGRWRRGAWEPRRAPFERRPAFPDLRQLFGVPDASWAPRNAGSSAAVGSDEEEGESVVGGPLVGARGAPTAGRDGPGDG